MAYVEFHAAERAAARATFLARAATWFASCGVEHIDTVMTD